MKSMLIEFVRDGLLAFGVLCGPGLWFVGIICALVAWQPGLDGAAALALLTASFACLSWAFWGIIVGPWRLRLWWFGVASFMNLVMGVSFILGGQLHGVQVGALFLGYSFWQFLVFRRPLLSKMP